MQEALKSMSNRFISRHFYEPLVTESNHWDNFARFIFGMLFINMRMANNRLAEKERWPKDICSNTRMFKYTEGSSVWDL